MSSGTSTKRVAPLGPSAADVPSSAAGKPFARLVRDRIHLLILVIPVVLVCLPFWPGHMNADTLNEIGEVITGNLTDYHAPILLGIWHLFWGVGVGPGWVLGGQVCCFVLGAYLLMRVVFGRVGAAIAATVLTLLPQDYGELGLVGRDTWYTALLLFSVGALAWGFAAKGSPRTPRRQTWTIAVSLIVGWLALAARPNAVTSMVVIFGAAIVLVRGTRWRDPALKHAGRLRRLAAVVLGAALLTVGFYASQSALNAVIGVRHAHPEQYIYDFDLAGMSIRENRDLFPRSILAASQLGALRHYFTLDDIVPELVAPGAPLLRHATLSANQVAAERSAEINAVEHAPFTWFGLHWDEFLRQVSFTRDANVIIHPGIDGNPFGLHTAFPGLDRRARGYVESFDQTNVPDPQGGIIFTVWIYLLIAIGGILSLRWWRDPRCLLVGTLALSSLAYQIGVFVSMGVQYRLELPTVVTGLVVLIIGGRTLLGGLRGSSWSS